MLETITFTFLSVSQSIFFKGPALVAIVAAVVLIAAILYRSKTNPYLKKEDSKNE